MRCSAAAELLDSALNVALHSDLAKDFVGFIHLIHLACGTVSQKLLVSVPTCVQGHNHPQ